MKNEPADSGTISGGARPRRLSEELDHLIAAFAERPVSLREVLDVLHGRGYTMLLLLLAIPFCTPIPLPGLSLPFGLVVAVIGLRLALGQRPWLPARLLDTRLPARFFPRLLGATRRLFRWLEHFLKPRLGGIVRWRPARHGMGAMVLVCGLLLTLPLPIPFSNGLPAFTVVLLAGAMLEEDGAVALAAGVVFLITLSFFCAIVWGGAELVNTIKETFGDILRPDDQPAPPPAPAR